MNGFVTHDSVDGVIRTVDIQLVKVFLHFIGQLREIGNGGIVLYIENRWKIRG